MKPLITLATRYLRSALVNYKTTLAGAAMIVHALYVFADHASAIANGTGDINPELLMIAKTEIIAGFGFISARDGDKTSQDSGLRK
jgi:hypothetical protein